MARPSEWPVCEGRSLNHAVACNSDDCGIMRPSARGFVRLISVRAESKHGKRLNPRKADLHRWRETFAEKLRGWGIDAEASRLGVELSESGRSVAPAPATCRHPATSAPRPSTALGRPAEATRLCHDPSRQTLSAAHAAGSRPTGPRIAMDVRPGEGLVDIGRLPRYWTGRRRLLFAQTLERAGPRRTQRSADRRPDG